MINAADFDVMDSDFRRDEIMKNARANADKQQAWKDRQRAKGLERFEAWVTPLEKEYIKWKLGEIRLVQGKPVED